ncbi:hypothetical protein AcW1_007382 [Taiwanofungus camphoratus]|nr:hypothetical protein AcW2_007552 [Antrodia cinnamomea]KAI0953061.1 hypothetical protein AcW1_007382 [Antrodia cinnamomea]
MVTTSIVFVQMVRTPKPTGNTEVPPSIEHAWAIDELINQRAHARPLNDSRIDGNGDPDDGEAGQHNPDVIEILSSGNEDDNSEKKPLIHRTSPASKKAKLGGYKPSSSVRTSNSTTAGPVAVKRSRPAITHSLLDNIAATFDPEAQAAREDARAAHNVQTSILNAVLVQMRDTQGRMDTLLDRLSSETRRADQLESELRFYDRLKFMGRGGWSSPASTGTNTHFGSPVRSSRTEFEYSSPVQP